MKNNEIFVRPPVEYDIPNLGVAKVGEPTTDQEWQVLDFELRNFVCEGEYRKGLERILSTFESSLSKPEQPAAWVSGFYGSGKSHFVKVLEALWKDMKMPNGASARGIVPITDDVKERLIELESLGRQNGGLWAAAGKLGSSASSIRLGILSILLRASGLPEDYGPASLVLWLIKERKLDEVHAALERRGTSLDDELPYMFISDDLAEALLEVLPNFASGVPEAKTQLAATFPTVDDISNDKLFAALDQILSMHSERAGKLPLMLVVVDELQQFLGTDMDKADKTLAVVEDISSHLQSRVLFVATGQSEMGATTELQRMQDRFKVRVTLGVSDVETVVRRVVLQKKPDAISRVEAALESISGEVRRQLAGTAIAPSDNDKKDMVLDYPLLPARRRFWDRVLRGFGNMGRAGQLRTQLRVVHEAVKQVADRDLGWVVPADVIFDQLRPDMLQTGMLLRETASVVDDLTSEQPDGELAARVCKIVFLIGKVPDDAFNPVGIRSDATTIADLLAEDLRTGSAPFRAKVPIVLDALAKRGILLPLADGEYRLQTKEGTEWQQAYQNNLIACKADLPRLRDARIDEFKKSVEALKAGVRVNQGASKETRKVILHFGDQAPSTSSGEIPIWVRDEWAETEKRVRDDARAAGTDSAVVSAFLPKRNADTLVETIASIHAREETLARPAPTTDAGKEARASMQSQLQRDREKLKDLIDAVLKDALVIQGGGTDASGNTFQAKLNEAANASAVRLFPKFSIGDHAKWGDILPSIKQGSGDPIGRVNHHGPPETHAVCKEILAFIGNGTAKGSAVRAHFTAPPYGWPRDTSDGALMALTAAGQLVAKRDGIQVEAKSFDSNTIAGAEFAREGDIITLEHRLALRALVTELLAIKVTDGKDSEAVRTLLDEMRLLATEAGGEPPIPARPSSEEVDRLRQYIGNRQLRETFDAKDELKRLFFEWSRRKKLITERKPHWERVNRLARQATGLPVATEVQPSIDAILQERRLLDEPDPTLSLRAKLTDALRAAITTAHARLEAARESAIATLEATDEWPRLNDDQRDGVLREFQLEPAPAPAVGTDDEVLATLERIPLTDWTDKLAAIPGRLDNARQQAAKLLEPKSIPIKLPKRTINTEADLAAFLDEIRQIIEPHLGEGPIII